MIIDLRRIIKVTKWLIPLLVIFYILTSKWFWRFYYPFPYKDLIIRYSYENKVDPYLVAAIIRAESRFSIGAESHRGARGIMQIMPETGKWAAEQMKLVDFEPDELYQPETNIKIGCWYINNLSTEFGDNKVIIIAAYNAGRGNVKEWLDKGEWNGDFRNIENIPFPETEEYVKRVLNGYKKYRWLYGGE